VNWLRQRKLSEMKSDFINSITHEFNTPLSAIIVANKAMQNEKLVQSKESLQPLNDVIQRQSERLRTLINQVLDITAMNKIQLVREDLSIHAQLDDILLDYRLKLNGSDADLRLYKDAEKDEVRADRFWLTTIVLNILDNAVKYNDKDQKVITVSTVSDKKFLYLRIRDNGVGIAREARKHVFEKFYRSASEERNGSKGLGLGLYYVKQAIDAHHWNIEVTSENGEGSTFTIAIPV
jgi:two-component system phosphate regulon sensor histidine kinase PhoR